MLRQGGKRIVYCATDINDKKVGNPFSVNDLGNFAGAKALEQKYIESKKAMIEGKMISPLKRHIDSVIAKSTANEELQRNLYAAGVGVIFREKSTG